MLYLLLAMLGSAAMSLVLKAFRAQRGNRYGIILGNYITCVLVGLLLMPDRSLILRGSLSTLLCGAAGGVFFVSGLVSMQSSIRCNGAALTAAFAKLGLVVTLGVSILCFGEHPGGQQLVGIALVFAALLLINGGAGGGEGKASFLLLLLVLLTGGGGDAMSKVFAQLGGKGEDTLYFFWLFLTAGVLAALLAWREYRQTGLKMLPAELAAGVLVGLPNYFSSLLLLRALERMPALVVYPMASTGTILLVTVLSALLFHEHITRRQAAGLGLILLALILLHA